MVVVVNIVLILSIVIFSIGVLTSILVDLNKERMKTIKSIVAGSVVLFSLSVGAMIYEKNTGGINSVTADMKSIIVNATSEEWNFALAVGTISLIGVILFRYMLKSR